MAQRARNYNSEADRREFELAREAALRTFKVKRTDGSTEIVKAHLHDAGDNKSGHLNFVLIEPSGRHAIKRGFAAGTWIDYEDITSDQQRETADRMRSQLREADEDDLLLADLPAPKRRM